MHAVILALALASPLAPFLATFDGPPQWRPPGGAQLFGGEMARDGETHFYFSTKREGDASIWVQLLRFQDAAAATRAVQGYAREADPARGHGHAWEVVVPKGADVFWVRAGNVTSQQFDALADRLLATLGGPLVPRLVCRDVGGCWSEPRR